MKQGKRAIGSVFQRTQDGRWVVRLTLPGGKRITRYAASREEGEKLLATLMTDSVAAAPAPYTVGTWLDEFLVRDAKGKAASTSKDRIRLAKGIRPGLGRTRLDKLTPAMVQAWSDRQEGSHRTRLKRLQLLRAALDQAMILGHVQRNVASPIRLERQPTKQVAQAWSKAEIDLFLDANKDSRFYLLWRLGLQTGARIGELLALRVEDYDPATRTLRFERTIKTSATTNGRTDVGVPKTPSSIRTFPLSKAGQEIVEAQMVRRVAHLVPTWQDEGWLFPNTFGGLLKYTVVMTEWRADLERARVRPIRMHDMRTTFISLAIYRGARAEVVAKIVGHKDPTITLRIYRQVYGEEVENVRDILDTF